MFNKNNSRQFTFTSFINQKFNRLNLENLKKAININDASKVSALQAHTRWDLSSVASNDSAFYDVAEMNNLKTFRNDIKFDNLEENSVFNEKLCHSSKHELM